MGLWWARAKARPTGRLWRTASAAHAGRDVHKGCSALYGLAELIVKVHEQHRNDSRGVTINFGQMISRSPANIVAELAVCRCNARFSDLAEFEKISASMSRISEQLQQRDPRLAIQLHLLNYRGPKPFEKKEEQLFEQYNQAANEEGYALSCRPTGGVCDGNLLAEAGIPALDTLGVVGGETHTENEYVRLDSLVPRAGLTARFLMNLASKGYGYG